MPDLELLDIHDLAKHTPDELIEIVLPEIESKVSYDDLYYRWEHQHWSATDIDFTQDRADWLTLEPVIQDLLLQLFGLFYQGEESVTRNLVPMMWAAPRIEHEVYLTTQTVDEARHMVLFRRLYNEVLGVPGDETHHMTLIRPNFSAAYINAFFGEKGLDGRCSALLAAPADRGLFVEAVTQYHLVLESGMALLGQRFLLDLCRNMKIMPGFYKGFMAVTRDESRHVGFGVRIVRELCEADPSLRPRVMTAMREAIPDMVRIANPPEREYDIRLLEVIPPEFFMPPQENHRYSMVHVMKRLTAAGFESSEVNELGAYAWTEFEAALNEWEERRPGQTHFGRLFADLHEAGPARVSV